MLHAPGKYDFKGEKSALFARQRRRYIKIVFPHTTHTGLHVKEGVNCFRYYKKKRHHSLSDILFSIHSGTTLHMYLFPAKSRESPKSMYAYTILVWPFMLHNSSRVEASNSQITQHSVHHQNTVSLMLCSQSGSSALHT